jgi:hypothetical protein
MRKLLSAVAVLSLIVSGAAFADHHEKDKAKDEKAKGWDGILIDTACSGGAKADDKKAEAHPKSCAMKESCAKSGYGIVTGGKFVAFDEKGNKLATKYLGVKEHTTKVHVMGELSKDGKTVTVKEITPQKKKDEKKDGEKKDEEKKDEKKE